LTWHNQKPITSHWIGVKHLMQYMYGTTNFGLHYKKTNNYEITCFVDYRFKYDEILKKSHM
jgi:hypothetical protein